MRQRARPHKARPVRCRSHGAMMHAMTPAAGRQVRFIVRLEQHRQGPQPEEKNHKYAYRAPHIHPRSPKRTAIVLKAAYRISFRTAYRIHTIATSKPCLPFCPSRDDLAGLNLKTAQNVVPDHDSLPRMPCTDSSRKSRTVWKVLGQSCRGRVVKGPGIAGPCAAIQASRKMAKPIDCAR